MAHQATYQRSKHRVPRDSQELYASPSVALLTNRHRSDSSIARPTEGPEASRRGRTGFVSAANSARRKGSPNRSL